MMIFEASIICFLVSGIVLVVRHLLIHGFLNRLNRSSKGQHFTSTLSHLLPQDMKPYILPSLHSPSSPTRSMGLKRLDMVNWLTIDSFQLYRREHAIRNHLLLTKHENVIQVLPSSIEACHEVLSLVSSFLTSRYPQYFTLATSSSGPILHNFLANETHLISPLCPNPLEVAARLSMEDFNVLIQDEKCEEWNLLASATLFPAGWKLQDRIGGGLGVLHGPVPGWEKELGTSVRRYFTHLSPRTAMERTNLFIQATPDLFVDAPESFSPPPSHIITPSDLYVRRERQTFRRLEKSGAVLFTVRTYMQQLPDLGDEELEALWGIVSGWDEVSKSYKGWNIWGEALEKWVVKRRALEKCGKGEGEGAE